MQQLRQETAVPEYADAFRSIRMAKFWLSLLTVLTLVVFLGSFIVVEFTTLLNETSGQAAVKPANVPETPRDGPRRPRRTRRRPQPPRPRPARPSPPPATPSRPPSSSSTSPCPS